MPALVIRKQADAACPLHVPCLVGPRLAGQVGGICLQADRLLNALECPEYSEVCM